MIYQQPNNNLKNLNKYDLDKVNKANHTLGQMEFDVSIKDTSKEEQRKKRIIKTTIISTILIIIVLFFSVTDLKYLIFPKKQKEVEKNLEDTNIIHELVCEITSKNDGLEVYTKNIYYYNNKKLKKLESTYTMTIIDEKIKNDKSLHDYIKTSFENTINSYGKLEGIKLEYKFEQQTHVFNQILDFTIIDKTKDINGLTALYLDENIDYIKENNSKTGIICK